ncbi:methionyl-tRNA formyltransferase [Candidatus Francisella endociliophora]|uniref:Cytokinin riboside 5'-monophosphate phosphoribohydrolase n=1 Tax=Candidatus Francisella endociliophora TaxID=653937 RepID=A0A097EN51_9GAMM|nr:TIGR00730 family Rossman fold protein [Francisella sp. FSC1006]AIT08992.1 methionyl-tRNA formyltransferase [Francisella sp. FSC1006]
MECKNKKIVPSHNGEITFDRAKETWNIMKITSELVEGYERLDNLTPAVSIFGSARIKEDNRYYKEAVNIAEKLSNHGFTIITGGGPGMMEAGNKGASKGCSHSVGLNITLPHEQKPNIFQDISLLYRYFFTRKAMFIKHSMAYVVMPGGFGTMDELFDISTLIQTGKKAFMPIILFGKDFWGGLMNWIKTTMIENGVIDRDDLKILHLVDTVDEVIEIIRDHYNNTYSSEAHSKIVF